MYLNYTNVFRHLVSNSHSSSSEFCWLFWVLPYHLYFQKTNKRVCSFVLVPFFVVFFFFSLLLLIDSRRHRRLGPCKSLVEDARCATQIFVMDFTLRILFKLHTGIPWGSLLCRKGYDLEDEKLWENCLH